MSTPNGHGMRDVARIQIATTNLTYTFTIPDMNIEKVEKLIVEAASVSGLVFSFVFPNERVDITEQPLYVHRFIRQENYPYDTPDIRIYRGN